MQEAQLFQCARINSDNITQYRNPKIGFPYVPPVRWQPNEMVRRQVNMPVSTRNASQCARKSDASGCV